jgi:hypothetical protein
MERRRAVKLLALVVQHHASSFVVVMKDVGDSDSGRD